MTKADQLWKSIGDDEFRREFNLDVDTGLAFQIRALREKNGWSQTELGRRAGGKRQKVISDWENPNYASYSLKSLKSLATAFDVGLMVRFVPFSELVEWNANLTPERIAPPSFSEEDEAGRVLSLDPEPLVVGIYATADLTIESKPADPIKAFDLAGASVVLEGSHEAVTTAALGPGEERKIALAA